MKNNLPQLGASTWQTVLRVSQVLTHQNLLKLEEKHFQTGPSGLSAGDPALWESPRPVLGQVQCRCAMERVPLLLWAEHLILSWGQIQSGRLARMTHEGKEKV